MLLLRNEGTRFTDVSGSAGEAFRTPRAARGAAFGDLNNDGFIDVAVCSQLSKAVVFFSVRNANHWLMIKLIGSVSNRDGIGARIRILTAQGQQFRTVSTASSYLASNDPRAHFGIGGSTIVDTVEIEWPSGRRQSIRAVAADQVLTVREP